MSLIYLKDSCQINLSQEIIPKGLIKLPEPPNYILD